MDATSPRTSPHVLLLLRSRKIRTSGAASFDVAAGEVKTPGQPGLIRRRTSPEAAGNTSRSSRVSPLPPVFPRRAPSGSPERSRRAVSAAGTRKLLPPVVDPRHGDAYGAFFFLVEPAGTPKPFDFRVILSPCKPEIGSVWFFVAQVAQKF